MTQHHEYEPFGSLEVIHGVREGRGVTVVRSRYRPMVIFCFVGGCLLATVGYFAWGWGVVGKAASVGLWLVSVVLWCVGPLWLRRGDWLIIDGERWIFKAKVDTGEHDTDREFTRADVETLVIDREPKADGNYGLKIRLRDGDLLLYSHSELETVRSASRRVSEALGVAVQEKV